MRNLRLILMLGLLSAATWNAGCGGGAEDTNPADTERDTSTEAGPDSRADSGLPCVRNEDCASGFHCDEGTCVENPLHQGCEASSCSGHGSCDDSTGELVCTCNEGYTGPSCGECASGFVSWPKDGTKCVDDPCDPTPCAGEHVLEDSCEQTSLDGYTCGCEQGFVWAADGQGCVPTPCEPDPCTKSHEVAGSCESTEADSFSCDCEAGYRWLADQEACVKDLCDPDPCTAEHVLEDSCEQTSPDGYTCGCEQGFVWNEDKRSCIPGVCDPDPCTRSHEVAGSCESTEADSFSCDCEAGYRWFADLEACVKDLCAPNPCTGAHMVGDSCKQTGVDTFVCACEKGYEWKGSACEAYCKDVDGDQYGEGAACLGSDCNDNRPDIHPGAVEACNGVDDDCDGNIDGENSANCTDYYLDADGDGWGSFDKRCLCAPEGSYTADKPNDCVDNDSSINPGAKERCDDVDNDCDALVDEAGASGCKTFYADFDQDGWGDSSSGGSKCLCAPTQQYTALDDGDCDDMRANVHPKAKELCNHIDDDCDGTVDEGCH